MADSKPRYRHEVKYLINYGEMEILANRLRKIASIDSHAGENGYIVRSLYFDDLWCSSYEEKLMGVPSRKKFRIRIYNFSDGHIALECKEKQGKYIYKFSTPLSRQETDDIINGHYQCLEGRTDELAKEFYLLLKSGMHPEVIADYDRIPFVYDPGTVRITFDMHIFWKFNLLFYDDRVADVSETQCCELLYTGFCCIGIVRDDSDSAECTVRILLRIESLLEVFYEFVGSDDV